jgi:transposase InsO family protein
MTSPEMILPRRGARTYFADPLFDHKIDPTMRDALQKLARAFVRRATDTGLIGQRRDEAALDFWSGASVSAMMSGHTELAEAIGKIGVLEIAKRGYSAIITLSL